MCSCCVFFKGGRRGALLLSGTFPALQRNRQSGAAALGKGWEDFWASEGRAGYRIGEDWSEVSLEEGRPASRLGRWCPDPQA